MGQRLNGLVQRLYAQGYCPIHQGSDAVDFLREQPASPLSLAPFVFAKMILPQRD